MRLLAILLAAGVLAGGCAQPTHETWSKPGATRHTVSRDYHECETAASVDPTHGQEQGAYGFSVLMDRRVLASCMRSRGYDVTAR